MCCFTPVFRDDNTGSPPCLVLSAIHRTLAPNISAA